MNAERFRTVMNAVDDDLLEQAVRPAGKRPVRIHRFAALAACLCIVVGLFWSRMTPHTLTEEDLLDAGYVLNLPEGTGYVTDLGMTGPVRSVLGIRPEQSMETFLGGLPGRYQVAPGPCKLQGVVFTLATDTGLCVGVEQIDIR